MATIQSRSNHARFDPGFHFSLVPALLVLLVISITLAIHGARHGAGVMTGVWMVGITFLLMYLAVKSRLYAMKVQDRVIRLEERLRLGWLLPVDMRTRIQELSEDQLIGLRFASDGEVAERMKEALDEKLNRAQIKERIRERRPDHWRV